MAIPVPKNVPADHVTGTKGQRIDGFPVFNSAPHVLVDLSAEQRGTISIKLPNRDYVTVALTSFGQFGLGGTLDLMYHGENPDTRVIAFNPNGTPDERAVSKLNFYTLEFKGGASNDSAG